MDLADIFDGDVIVVRRQASAQDNNYVVALVDGSSTFNAGRAISIDRPAWSRYTSNPYPSRVRAD